MTRIKVERSHPILTILQLKLVSFSLYLPLSLSEKYLRRTKDKAKISDHNLDLCYNAAINCDLRATDRPLAICPTSGTLQKKTLKIFSNFFFDDAVSSSNKLIMEERLSMSRGGFWFPPSSEITTHKRRL
ncbi:hypothetical protein CEXT_149301 [Caerostris extrusa]|uniref:Uncharacterized protein n=1 Tax=Caerostris extrusa TaxID=172846 RepID=A0AAV4Y2M5_CAEEX|nr:hypothetical protein CEXT_149301 [Caerostris extrusa]